MTFADFCRSLGLIVDTVEQGRWVRTRTKEHPHKKNGAYKCLGTIGWAQNHATMVDVDCWRSDEPQNDKSIERVVRQVAEFDQKMRDGWDRAAKRAQQLLSATKTAEHPYLYLKGFPKLKGLVVPTFTRAKRVDDRFVERTNTDVLMVPMRDRSSNSLLGAQMVFWDADERRWKKEMLSGMRAKGAVLRLGPTHVRRTWMVEGYATGLSLQASLQVLRANEAVLVCFSDGNLVHVAKSFAGPAAVFADNDVSGAGERAARRTGLPWCMSPVVGEDANDMWLRAGAFETAALTLRAQAHEEEAVT